MALLVDEKYRNLMTSVHEANLEKFRQELQQVGYHPRACLYAKTLDNVVHVIAQLGRDDFLRSIIEIFPDDHKTLLEVTNVGGTAMFTSVTVVYSDSH